MFLGPYFTVLMIVSANSPLYSKSASGSQQSGAARHHRKTLIQACILQWRPIPLKKGCTQIPRLNLRIRFHAMALKRIEIQIFKKTGMKSYKI